jgi:hypothetical protein
MASDHLHVQDTMRVAFIPEAQSALPNQMDCQGESASRRLVAKAEIKGTPRCASRYLIQSKHISSESLRNPSADSTC